MPTISTGPTHDLVIEHCESCGVVGLAINVDRNGRRQWHDVQHPDAETTIWTPHTVERCRAFRAT